MDCYDNEKIWIVLKAINRFISSDSSFSGNSKQAIVTVSHVRYEMTENQLEKYLDYLQYDENVIRVQKKIEANDFETQKQWIIAITNEQKLSVLYENLDRQFHIVRRDRVVKPTNTSVPQQRTQVQIENRSDYNFNAQILKVNDEEFQLRPYGLESLVCQYLYARTRNILYKWEDIYAEMNNGIPPEFGDIKEERKISDTIRRINEKVHKAIKGNYNLIDFRNKEAKLNF